MAETLLVDHNDILLELQRWKSVGRNLLTLQQVKVHVSGLQLCIMSYDNSHLLILNQVFKNHSKLLGAYGDLIDKIL